MIAAEIINQMLDFVRCDDGDCVIKDYIEDYKSRSMVLGERIKILNTGEFALVQDINESGALVLKLDSSENQDFGQRRSKYKGQRNRKMRLFYEENRNGSIVILVLLACFPICGYAIEFDMDEICDSVVVVHSMNSVGTGFAISKDKTVTNQHVVSTTTTYTIETRDGGL